MIPKISSATISKSIIIVVFCSLAAIMIQPASAGDDFFHKPRPLISLSEGWQYRWGDSPLNGQGIPLWILDDAQGNKLWNSFQVPGQPTKSREWTSVWLRVRLPADEWQEPGILFSAHDQSFRVFLDGRLIYRYGDFQDDKQKMTGSPWHFISLPANYQSKFLYFHLDSIFKETTGLIRMAEFGSHSQAQLKIVRSSIDYLILGSLFIIIGFSLIIIFTMEKLTQKSFFSLGFFSVSAGIWLISETNMRQILFDIPHFYLSYSATGSLYLMPIGICAFVEQIFGGRYRLILRRLWQADILFTIVAFALDWLNLIPLAETLSAFYLLLVTIIILLILVIFSEVAKGNREAKIFGWGIVVFATTGIYDILGWYFRIVPWERYTTHWGLFVFFTLLMFLLRKHYHGIYQKLWEYSNEIQLKNETLNQMWLEVNESREIIAEWNKTLEQRVVERTEQLAEANNELVLMLETLQRTQNRLIQSEKMSSLGGLVAGVAHEINTPITISVTAASHLAERTAEITEAYQNKQIAPSGLGEFFELGREMCKIILTNLDRAASLVRSFKQVAVDQSNEAKRLFKVRAYLEEIFLSLQPKLKKTKHQMRIECGDDLKINSYPGALSQIITNLVLNSLIHAFNEADSGIISIKVTRNQRMLSISYSDNGKGISKEDLELIFIPFFTTSGDSGGTGLGLPIVHKLVTKTLGGTISCQSQPGQGTSFSISFPVEEDTLS